MDIIARGMAVSAESKAELAVNMIADFPSGLKYKGKVNDISDLPASADVGDAYTVVNEDNKEYAWNGSEWSVIGPDFDAYALKSDLVTKLTEPSSNLAVGKYFRIASIDENGHAVLECVDPPTVPVKSITAAGQTITPDANGNWNIRVANYAYHGNPGLVCVKSAWGLENPDNKSGLIRLAPPLESQIPQRKELRFKPVTLGLLDVCVKAAMCDGIGPAWTDAEKLAALLRMGCTVDENGFVKWTATPSEGE